MTKMKKLLALLLAIVMVMGMFPMNVFAENEEATHLDTCVEGCTGCECTCHQVNPASDDPAEPESPADNCPNCDDADCTGCDGGVDPLTDGGAEPPEPQQPTVLCEKCGATEANEDGSVKHAETCETLKPAVLCDKCGATETNEDGSVKHAETCETLKPAVLCDKCGAAEANEDGSVKHAETCENLKPAVLCDKCGATETNEDGSVKHAETCETLKPAVLCEQCNATKDEAGNLIHEDLCPTKCTCEPIDGVHQGECIFAPVVENAGPQVGDKIWIKHGSLTYKQPDENSKSREVIYNYETKIVSIITDDDGNPTWYEFRPTGLLWLYREYKYVHVENTTIEEPEDTNECNCENPPEKLADHADSCPRKTFIKTLFENKTAEEIYAEWETYDEVTRNDILEMLEVYNKTTYTVLNVLLGNGEYPTEVELDDGTTVSVAGIPEDAWLSVEVPDVEKTQAVSLIADNMFAIDSSVAHGGVLSLNYDIKIMQGEDEWQPANGESVYVTLEVPDFHLDYRTYLQGIHILDTAEAVQAAVNSGEAMTMTEAGLTEAFPAETSAAVAAGFPENTIVYTIMLPETGDMYVDDGNLILDMGSFSTVNVTAFNVDNSAHSGDVEDAGLIVNKTATVDYVTGEGYVELSSYVKGSVSNTPTDVVLVIDHSGSMWTAVDPANPLRFDELDKEKGTYEGYYAAFKDVGPENYGKTVGSTARLVRYYNGKWQWNQLNASVVRDENGAFLGFINTIWNKEYGNADKWVDISTSDINGYIFAVSISGALNDALNIFMDEMQNAQDCRVAICTFAGRPLPSESYEKEEMKSSSSHLEPDIDFKGSGIFIDGVLTWDGTAQTLDRNSNDDDVLDDYENAFEDPSTEEGKRKLNQTIANINTDYGNTPTALGLLYARRLFNEGGRGNSNKVAIVFTDGLPSPNYLRTRNPDSCGHGNIKYYHRKDVTDTEKVKNFDTLAAAKEAAFLATGGQVTTNANGDTVYISGCLYCEPIEYMEKSGDTYYHYYRSSSTYVDQAHQLKTGNKATIYSIGPTAGRAGTDVLANIATSSDHYFNASGSDIAKVFRDIAGFIVSSSQEVDENSRTIDKISGYFDLPANTDSTDIDVYTADYKGTVNGIDQFDELVAFDGAIIEIPEGEKQVQVYNFDYEGNAVAMEGTHPTGKKLVIRIPIETEPDFLGGNNVPTNASAGIYNNNGTTLVTTFPEPDANVKVKEMDPKLTSSDIYLSQKVTVPHIANVGKYWVDDVQYQVNGINNKYVDITYTVTGPDGYEFTYTIPAGTKYENIPLFGDNAYVVLEEDATYAISYSIVSTGNENNKSSGTNDAGVRVFKPVVTFRDSCIDLGKTADFDPSGTPTGETVNYVSVTWMHENESATTAMGNAPELRYTYDTAETGIIVETPVRVTAVKAIKDLKNNVPEDKDDMLEHTKFYRQKGCEFPSCEMAETGDPVLVNSNGINFKVHLNNFDLVITKDGTEDIDHNDQEAQTYVFRVTNEDTGFSMDVTIVGDGSTTIKSLPAGVYKVTELADWSWRYEPKNNPVVVSSANVDNLGQVTAPFVNGRDNPSYWLSGDSYCENWWRKNDNGTFTVTKRIAKPIN